jgi:hypothetical protein
MVLDVGYDEVISIVMDSLPRRYEAYLGLVWISTGAIFNESSLRDLEIYES